jgi:hypothetical protein
MVPMVPLHAQDAASTAPLEKVPVHKTRKGKRNEKRARDGIKLPSLRRNLANALLKKKANAADRKIANHQFKQTQTQTFYSFEPDDAEQSLADKWQIGGE